MNYTRSGPAPDLQTQADWREGDHAHLEEASWVILLCPDYAHPSGTPPPPRSRPLLDPSSGCGHLVWLGCHILCDWDRSRVITDLGLCRTPSGTHSYLLATSRALLSILTTEHFRLCPMTVPRGSLHISSHVTI